MSISELVEAEIWDISSILNQLTRTLGQDIRIGTCGHPEHRDTG